MWKLAILVGLGAAAWYWREDILSAVETQFPGTRERAARTFEEATGAVDRAYEQATSRLGNA
jgi:hypothetical protein